MAAYHSDEILDAATLPLRYAAFSPCFRKEAGSHGKDTKGIIRVHWFDKVEMFVYTTLEESYAEHQRLLEIEKEFLDKLELAYQVIDTAAGDLGLSATRKFDCEAWIPTQGKYRELTSTSNCTDFQARRLDIRGRVRGQTSSRSRPSTARCAHRPAPSSRSSRPTSRPTARCKVPEGAAGVARARGPGARRPVTQLPTAGRPAAGRARHRRHAAQVGRGRRDDPRGDLAGRCTTPCTARSTPAPTSCSPAAARRTA